MEQIFLKLVNISVTASWIVLAVVLLRFALKKAPKWTTCLLWAIVGLRLIIPFSLESALSLIPSTEIIDTDTYQVQTGVDIIDDTVNGYLDRYKENVSIPVVDDTNAFVNSGTDAPINQNGTAPTDTPVDIAAVCSGIWVVGMAVMAAYSVISYLRLRRRVAASIHCRNQVYFCDNIRSAFILGIIRPRIYLPSGMTEEQMAYVIRHEKAHLRRKDHFWKPLGFAVLTVYWFNPVLWAAYILLCRDIEMACDERAVKNMDTEAKKGYSEALVACSVQRRMIMACPIAFGEVGVKDRIKAMANYRKPAFWVVVIAVVACILTAVCFLTDPVKKVTVYSYSNAEKTYKKLQAEQASKNSMTKEDYLAYSELFRMIAEGAGKEMDQFADLTRQITKDSVQFQNQEVFTVAEIYAEAYAKLGTGKNIGIQDLALQDLGYNFRIEMEYLGDIRYSVKMIEIGDSWYFGPNDDHNVVPYNGELGDYVVEISVYDCGIDSEFAEKYPSGIHSLGQTAPGSNEIMLKHVATADHGHKFYIGSDAPIKAIEQAVKKVDVPIGILSITLLPRGVTGEYKNVRSLMQPDFEWYKYNVVYYDTVTNMRLTTEEAHARYGVDKEDIKQAVEAHTYAKHPNFDQLPEQEQERLRKNFSDENIEACQLFSTENGKLMIVARTYTPEDMNIIHEVIELPA